MKKLTLSIVVSVMLLALTACGADRGSGPLNMTYVNPLSGSDLSGNGSKDNPYKTLSYALAAPSSQKTIQLADGLYDSENSEKFPITVPADKTIIGNADDPTAVVVSGAGTFTSSVIMSPQLVNIVLGGDNSVLSNITVRSEGGIAVWDENDISAQTTIFNSIVIDSERGIVSANASTMIIADTTISGNDTGIELLNSSASILVSSNITDNVVGMTIQDEAMPLFNFFTSGSANIISNNSACDLRHLGSNDFSAIGVLWDDDVFDFTISDTCSDGANIVIFGLGAITYQFIPNEDSPIFPGTNLITVDSPAFGEVIFTQEPNFVWTPNSSNTTVLVVMDHPPALNFSRIVNIEQISWFWHQGLGSGSQGMVSFSDGARLNSEKIDDTSPAVPLEKGRSYYWAIWEWNEDNAQIISSSALNYFRISTL